MVSRILPAVLAALAACHAATPILAQGDGVGDTASMKAYTESISGTQVSIPLVPIPVGQPGYAATFTMGSPVGESGREKHEGPAVRIGMEPFWIGKFEITWDTYNVFRQEYSILLDGRLSRSSTPDADWLDAVSIPTPLWEQDSAPILQGMGQAGGYPVADISRFAAMQFTKWLSKKTGRFYRLPTEAEWEYAARAGTRTAYSFGDDPAALDDHAWTFDNSAYDDPDQGYPGTGAGYRKVGLKKPNPWGLHDIHGNVSEWVIDAHTADGFQRLTGKTTPSTDAISWPSSVFPGMVRGGNWESDPEACRSASRLASTKDWQQRDPQLPKSIWWYTDAFHVGFRIVRPLKTPSVEEQRRFWESGSPKVQRIIAEGEKELRVPIVGKKAVEKKIDGKKTDEKEKG